MQQSAPSIPRQQKQQMLWNAWCELSETGHVIFEATLGIWNGPGQYEVRFLGHGMIIESMQLHIGDAREFDLLREHLKGMVHG